MPGRDKTGPEGAGAMTGRRMGQCSGGGMQGAGCGLGRGRGGRGRGEGMRCGGRGRGMGAGRPGSYAVDQEITMLRHDIEILKEQLNNQ
jgi:hypothetical protein